MKKKFLTITFMLAMCLMLPALLCACGEAPVKYAWDKEFNYSGAYVDNFESTDSNGTKKIDLLKQDYNNNNLDLANITFGDIKLDLQDSPNFETFVSLITSKVQDTFAAKYSNFSVKVGNQENKTIVINNKTYRFEAVPNSDVMLNIIDDTKEENNQNIGIFVGMLSSYGDFKDYLDIVLYEYLPPITVKIPTTNTSAETGYEEDENMKYISLQFYAKLNEVENA